VFKVFEVMCSGRFKDGEEVSLKVTSPPSPPASKMGGAGAQAVVQLGGLGGEQGPSDSDVTLDL